MSPERVFSLAAILVLALAAPGCAFFSTLQECRDLTQTVNPVLVTVRETLEQGKDRPETYATVARMYGELAKILKQKQYGTRLHKLTADYVELSESVSKNALAFERALAKGRKHQLKALRTAAKQHTAKQRQLNRRVESICRGR